MPAEHQRVFFIEEKACRAPESFLYRGKGLPDAREFSLSRKRPAERQRVFFIEEKACQTPVARPRGFFLSWKRNPIRTRAPPALASGTFFVPFAHVDRHAGQSPSHPTSWVLGAVAW